MNQEASVHPPQMATPALAGRWDRLEATGLPVPSTCVLRSQAWLPHGVPVWGASGLPYGVTEKHGDLPGCDVCGDRARWGQRGQKCFGAVAEPPSGSPEGGQQCSLCPHPRGCTVHPGEAWSAERWCGPWSLMLGAPGWFWEVRSGQTWLPCASPDLTWTRALLTRDSRNKKASLLQLLKLSALRRAALRTSGSLVLMVLGNPGFASDLRIWAGGCRQGPPGGAGDCGGCYPCPGHFH